MATEEPSPTTRNSTSVIRISRNATALGPDGALGTVHQIIMDQHSGELQALVIAAEGTPSIELPATHVLRATSDTVYLDVSAADLRQHPDLAKAYNPDRYVPVRENPFLAPSEASRGARFSERPVVTNIERDAVGVVVPQPSNRTNAMIASMTKPESETYIPQPQPIPPAGPTEAIQGANSSEPTVPETHTIGGPYPPSALTPTAPLIERQDEPLQPATTPEAGQQGENVAAEVGGDDQPAAAESADMGIPPTIAEDTSAPVESATAAAADENVGQPEDEATELDDDDGDDGDDGDDPDTSTNAFASEHLSSEFGKDASDTSQSLEGLPVVTSYADEPTVPDQTPTAAEPLPAVDALATGPDNATDYSATEADVPAANMQEDTFMEGSIPPINPINPGGVSDTINDDQSKVANALGDSQQSSTRSTPPEAAQEPWQWKPPVDYTQIPRANEANRLAWVPAVALGTLIVGIAAWSTLRTIRRGRRKAAEAAQNARLTANSLTTSMRDSVLDAGRSAVEMAQTMRASAQEMAANPRDTAADALSNFAEIPARYRWFRRGMRVGARTARMRRTRSDD